MSAQPPSFQPSTPPSNSGWRLWGNGELRCDPGVLKASAHLSLLPPTPICPAKALPSPGFSKGKFKISLFIHVQRGEKKKRERPRKKKKIPHCQSNAKLSLSGMSRADAAMRCQSGSPSSAPWVPINCSGARLSASSSPGRWYPGRILPSVSLSLGSRP